MKTEKKIIKFKKNNSQTFLNRPFSNNSILVSTSSTFKKTFGKLKKTAETFTNNDKIIPPLKKTKSELDVVQRNQDNLPFSKEKTTNSFFMEELEKEVHSNVQRKSSFKQEDQAPHSNLQPEEDYYKYFSNHNFIDDILEFDPTSAEKLINLRKLDFHLKKANEVLIKDIKQFNYLLDRKESGFRKRAEANREFIASATDLEAYKRRSYQALKREALKPKKKEKKMAEFKIPGVLEKPKQKKEEDSVDQLLPPNLKKIIRLKFKKDNNDIIIYRSRRLNALSDPRTIYKDRRSSFHKELVNTCNKAGDENLGVLRKLLLTRKSDIQYDMDMNLYRVNKLLDKKFYIK